MQKLKEKQTKYFKKQSNNENKLLIYSFLIKSCVMSVKLHKIMMKNCLWINPKVANFLMVFYLQTILAFGPCVTLIASSIQICRFIR